MQSVGPDGPTDLRVDVAYFPSLSLSSASTLKNRVSTVGTGYAEVIPVNLTARLLPDCRPLVQNRRIRRAPRQHEAHTARASNQCDRVGAQDFRGGVQVHAAGLHRNAGPVRCLAKACIFGAYARLLTRWRLSESGQSIPKSHNTRYKTAWRIGVTRSKERA
jgi:hypothetical protein